MLFEALLIGGEETTEATRHARKMRLSSPA